MIVNTWFSVCTGKVIDSVNAATELKDCNIVKGPLQINIRQGGISLPYIFVFLNFG